MMGRIGTVCVAVLFLLSGLVGVRTTHATQPPIDPKKMSGISRPDPQVPAGYLTVRCLGEAGFSAPMMGTTVSLAVTGTDGKNEVRIASTDGQGRATFGELESFTGGTAVASATLGQETVSSRPIPIAADTGTRVMLVQGAAAAAADTGKPPRPSIPMPGTAFPMAGTTVGELTVGTYDLAAKKPLAGVDVTATITAPAGESTVRKLKTDAAGKVVFDKLAPPDLPAETTLVVEATLVEGGALRKSGRFVMSSASGMALVLAEGAEHLNAAKQGGPSVPPPHVVAGQSAGTVQVVVGDAGDKPVKGHLVTVIKKTATGQTTFAGTTDDVGLATIEDIELAQNAIYYVHVLYDGAPYESPTFLMDSRGGVALGLRVYEVTSDPSVVRAVVQYHVDPAEGDSAQVVQVFEAKVTEGTKAYWPGGERLEIGAVEGATGFTVLSRAQAWLGHVEGAPFATLIGPIPPGEVANLSVGYFVPSDGTITLEWSTPFQLLDARIVVSDGLTLEAAEAKPSDIEVRTPDAEAFTLGPRTAGGVVSFAVSGVPVSNPIYRRVGIGGALLMVMAAAMVMLFRPRESARAVLERQQQALIANLEAVGEKGDAVKRGAVLAALDRVHRQLRALDDFVRERG